MPQSEKVVFNPEDLAGSRLRCLMMTSGSREQVAERLTELMRPCGAVDHREDRWMPGGFLDKAEAQLGRTETLLTSKQREELLRWWLKKCRGARTPNWDIASSCNIGDQRGLLLVEAKAHDGELKEDDHCESEDKDNREQIALALSEASRALGDQFKLQRDSHYQLSNRFAWSWKLASMGIPVILVYLGFLNADEMPQPFSCPHDWREAVLRHANRIAPEQAWSEQPIPTTGASMRALIRAVDLSFVVRKEYARRGVSET